MESSCRDLPNDMAEHGSILKNNQNTYNPVLVSRTKTGIELPEKGVSFLLCFSSCFLTFVIVEVQHREAQKMTPHYH